MKKISINQPYFFPYMLYFKMIRQSDTFVILDDVNFQKKGFINRNSIKSSTSAFSFTIPLTKVSQNRKISDISTCNWIEYKKSLRKRICNTLSEAPNIDEALYVFDQVNFLNDISILELNRLALEAVCSKFKISSEIVLASEICSTKSKGQNRIIDICKELAATEYLNLPGGTKLYDKDAFGRNGIELKFIDQSLIALPADCEFLRYSSIISAIAYGQKV